MKRAMNPKNRPTGLPRRGASRRARPEPAVSAVLVSVTVPHLLGSMLLAVGGTRVPGHASRQPTSLPDRITQGRRDSNPQPPVLETGALPIEPLPYVRLYRGRAVVQMTHSSCLLMWCREASGLA